MRKIVVSLVFLICLCLSLLFWQQAKTDSSVSSSVDSDSEGGAKKAPATLVPPVVSPEREVKAPLIKSLPAAEATADAGRDEKKYYATSRLVMERSTPPNAQGEFRKLRLIETGEKYPFVRIEESWLKDAATGKETLVRSEAMVADHVMVQLHEGQTRETLEVFVKQAGGEIRRQVGRSKVYLVSTPKVSLDEIDRVLGVMRAPGSPARTAEPDFIVHASFTPNDPSFNSLWGLHNTGQTGGMGDADIDAVEAWEASRGSTNVIVGVIDTGIDYNHPDLAANMWVNAGEIPNNGIDDDGNGYVDDARGWDFVGNDKDPMDDHYHGTHCAGTIGAVGNNGIGVAGVCHQVKLMALKFLSSNGSGTTSDAVEAVLYATDNGAMLTSNSWGGGGYSQALKDAIDEARDAGVLFVVAAGNNQQNTDTTLCYPASYSSANIISVAATDASDVLASFSNYGASTVDIAAPGVSIYSTSPGGGYRTLSGTSMACPHVAGACALVYAAHPTMSWVDVRSAILNNVDGIASLTGKVATGGRLNIARALIIATGPYLTVAGLQVRDDTTNGALGNGDGVLNPGEDIALTYTLKNIGSQSAVGLSSQMAVLSGQGPVTLLQGSKTWGDLAAGDTSSNAATPFRIRLAPTVATPHRFILRLTTSDNAGHSWVSDSEFTVLTKSTVQGKVVLATGGTPVVGATITYTGPTSGSVTTGTGGTYTLNLTDGTYVLGATATNYNPSTETTVTVPPNLTGIDFTLGRSRIVVSPTSLTATQYENTVSQRTVTVTNSGNLPLTVGLGSSLSAASFGMVETYRLSLPGVQSLGAASAADISHALPGEPVSATGEVSSLPFEEDFESGSLTGWNLSSTSGVREVVSGKGASGTKSFHFNSTGTTEHFTGIHRDITPGSQPGYVSFWVQTSSTTASSGYFVLRDGSNDVIWFSAKSDGKFYANGDVGGDETVPYGANNWYRIEFKDINWWTKNFDYYVNGVLVKANIPFRNAASVNEVTQLYLYNFSPGVDAWWDGIRVQNDEVDWLRYSPAVLNLAAGASATVTVTLDATGMAVGTHQGKLELSSNDPANPVVSAPVTLSVQQTPNTPPVAANQTVTLAEDTPTVITMTGTDAEGNALTAQLTELPASGTVYQTVDGSSPGVPITAVPATITHSLRKVIYVPAPDASGNALAMLKFVLLDQRSISNTGTITLNVTAVNDAPVAANDFAGGQPGATMASIAVLENDKDVDGDTLSISSFTQGQRGTVANNGNGTLRYTPGAGFNQGTDAFTYTVSDGRGGTSTAEVAVSLGYLTGGNWPMMGNGPAHTGFYPANLNGQSFTPNWTLTFNQGLNQVSIANGQVFVTPSIYFNETHVSAVDLHVGTVTWKKSFETAFSLTGPSFHQGRVYLQRGNHGSDSQLWSLNASTGATVWSQPFSAQWENYLPPTLTDTSVYVNGGYYGGMYGYNRSTGAQIFYTTLPQVDGWTPTVGNNAVYSCVQGVLRSHHPTSGTVTWSHTLDTVGTMYDGLTTAYDSGRVYIAAAAGLYAITVSGTTPVRAWRADGTFTGTPAVAAGKVYALTTGKVQQFDAATGVWQGDFVTSGMDGTYQPIVTNDALIVASDSKVLVFSLATRTLIQTINYGGIVSLCDGNLLIAGTDIEGVLRCYTITSGSNTTPLAQSQTATCTEDQVGVITLGGTDADGNALAGVITSLPLKGTLYQTTDGVQPGQPITTVPALVSHPQCKVIYRPEADGFGAGYASFMFKVNDGTTSSAVATVTVNVTGVNDAPVAVDDKIYTRAGTALDPYWPSANDVDVDGEPLQIVSFTQPAHGRVTQNGNGSLSYVSAGSFPEGTESFQYTLRDGAGLTATATVQVVISASFGRDWPTWGGSNDHANRYTGSLGASTFSQRWQFTSSVGVNPPVFADGRVFYSNIWSVNGYMIAGALDAVTGAEVWRIQMPSANSLNPPTYYNGTIYLQRGNHGNDTQLWALNARDGSLKWSSAHGAQWESYLAPCVSELGAFIDGGSYGGIYGFHQTTGVQKFFYSLEQYDQWTPSLHAGVLYSFVAGKLRSHNLTTGAENWALDLGWNWQGWSMGRTPAFDSGRAYLVNNKSGGNELVCVNLANRTALWRVQAAFTGTPAVSNGIVYALSGNMVKTYGASSGQWLGDLSAPVGQVLLNAPVVSNDLLIASSASSTFIFDLVNRQVLQTLAFGSQVAVADGVIYMACSDMTIRAYSHPVAGNHAPAALASTATVNEDSQVTVQLQGTDEDGDSLLYTVRTLPTKGTLYQTSDGITRGAAILNVPSLIENINGQVIYVTALNEWGTGTGSFTFCAHDRSASSPAATVAIDVTPVNDPPVAIADTVAVRPGESLLSFHPESNDRDSDGDVLTVVAVTQGTLGQAYLISDGTVQYVPNLGVTSGTGTFGYTVRDGSGVTASATVSVLISATAGREWLTFGGSPSHSGFVPVVLGSSPFALRWTSGALPQAAQQVAVADGRVYTTHAANASVGKLRALDASSGGELWRVSFSSGTSVNPCSAHAGDVYMQLSNHSASRLYSLNGTDGSERWSSPFSAQWNSFYAPAVDTSGVFINGGYYGGIYGFQVTGQQLFSQSMEGYDLWTPTLHQGGMYSFVSGVFRSHNRSTGAVIWSADFGWSWYGWSMYCTTACEGNKAFLVNHSVTIPAGDQEVIAVDLTAHTAAWKARGVFIGTPAVAHQNVYVISAAAGTSTFNKVQSYDVQTGALTGVYTATGGETALQWQPILTNDCLITYSATKTYIFDLKTKVLRQTIAYGGYCSLAGDKLYIASSDGYIRAFAVPDMTNRAPSATAVALATAEDTQVTASLSGSDPDNDAISFVITQLPQAGTLYQTADGTTCGLPITSTPAVVSSSPSRVIYVPPQDRSGIGLGSFGYAASDTKTLSPQASVSINVIAVNDAPLAYDDVRTVPPGQLLSPLREVLNDTDRDGDVLQILSFTQPPSGIVERNNDGTLRYVPPVEGVAVSPQQFQYTIQDAAGATATATVTITTSDTIEGYWPMYGNGAEHRGYVPTTLGRVGWSARWYRTFSGATVTQAAVAGGKIYISGKDGVPFVAALAERSGDILWRRDFSSANSMNPPAYHDGRLYVQRGNHGSDTQMICLRASDGQPEWTTPHAAQWESYLSPTVTAQGVFCNGGYYGGMYGFDPVSGTQLFFRSLAQTDRWTPTISGGELFSFVNGVFTSHNLDSGTNVWSLNLGWGGFGYSMNRTTAVAGRAAYLVNDSPTSAYDDEDLVCINLDTHVATWSVNGNFAGTPAVNNGMLYVYSGNTVQARSADTGALISTFTASPGDLLAGQPVITDDAVIAQSGLKTYVFGRYDQTLLHVANRGGTVSVVDDQIIVSGSDGVVAAYAAQPAVTFSPPGGTFTQPAMVALSAADPNSRIYYTLDGSMPNLTSPWVTSGKTVRISWSGKIKAIMVKGSAVSRVNEATFVMLDTDADGLPDWWEQEKFGSLTVAGTQSDQDGDGILDVDEFGAGTNPMSGNDRFSVTCSVVRPSLTELIVSWDSKLDRLYMVERSEDMVTWETMSEVIPGTGGVVQKIISVPSSSAFVRVNAVPRVIEAGP